MGLKSLRFSVSVNFIVQCIGKALNRRLSKIRIAPYCYLQFKSKRREFPLFHNRKSNNLKFINNTTL